MSQILKMSIRKSIATPAIWLIRDHREKIIQIKYSKNKAIEWAKNKRREIEDILEESVQ